MLTPCPCGSAIHIEKCSCGLAEPPKCSCGGKIYIACIDKKLHCLSCNAIPIIPMRPLATVLKYQGEECPCGCHPSRCEFHRDMRIEVKEEKPVSEETTEWGTWTKYGYGSFGGLYSKMITCHQDGSVTWKT